MKHVLIVLIAVLSGSFHAAAQTVLYVNQNSAHSGVGDGVAWPTAYKELRDALNDPRTSTGTRNNPVEIWIARGTYKPTSGTDRTVSFMMKSHLRLRGGFAGNETTSSGRFFFDNQTVLSGDIGRPQANAVTSSTTYFPYDVPIAFDPSDPGFLDNSFTVVQAQFVTDAMLELMTIAGGNADSRESDLLTIEAMSTAHTLEDAEINDSNLMIESYAASPPAPGVAGGGAFVKDVPSRPNAMNVTFEYCRFLGNSARGYGGGLAVDQANVVIRYGVFKENRAGFDGGAIYGVSHWSQLVLCDFHGNSAGRSGGAFAYQSFPSSRSVLPNYDDAQFLQKYGQNKGYVIAATRSGVGMASLSQNMYAMPLEPAEQTIAERASAALQRSGFLNRVLEFGLKKSAGIEGNPYGKIMMVVKAANLVHDLALALGAEDNVHARNWRIGFAAFERYATPEGWATLLSEAIEGDVPRFRHRVTETRRFQLAVYNSQQASIVFDCTFGKNIAGVNGGAGIVEHDNVQIENSVFEQNSANIDGGGLYSFGWNTPILLNTVFYQNTARDGHSAFANSMHSRAQIINCTFVKNGSGGNEGYAVSVELGSDVKISNSILWNNTNTLTANLGGGADLFVATRQTLATNELQFYAESGPGFNDWIGLCDLSFSTVQSLKRLPLGSEEFALPDIDGTPTEEMLRQVDANRALGDLNGTLESYGILNLGEGIRPATLAAEKANSDADPLLIDGYILSYFSPAIGKGRVQKFNNGVIHSFSSLDVMDNPRVVDGKIDMGAAQNTGEVDETMVVHVKPAATGNGSGTNWANATTLQEALSRSYVLGASIWVAAGTYLPTPGTNRHEVFRIPQDASLYGGFTGTETALSQRDWQVHPTILSGNIGAANSDADNSYTVVRVENGPWVSAAMDGFIITKARGETIGSALVVNNSRLALRNCRFEDNRATSANYGGAVTLFGIHVRFTGCEFINNTSAGRGGALNLASGESVTIDACLFKNNTAGRGGAIAGSVYCTINNSLFAGNSAIELGGAVFSEVSHTFRFCTFSDNRVVQSTASPVGGGALFHQSGPLNSIEVSDSIFWGNRVINTGGPTPSLEEQQIKINQAETRVVHHNVIEGLATLIPANHATTFNNIDQDPIFLNAVAGDFRLNAFSPAINQASQAGGAPPLDLAGQPRLFGRGDMGAYEFQGEGQSIVATTLVTNECDSGKRFFNLAIEANIDTSDMVLVWQVDRLDGLGYGDVTTNATHQITGHGTLSVIEPPLAWNGYWLGMATAIGCAASGRFRSRLSRWRSKSFLRCFTPRRAATDGGTA
jgi:predicted outer membrane repeat protein